MALKFRYCRFGEIARMSPLSAATSDAICVLIADSSRMQAQLLTNALRRYPEFRVSTARMELSALLHSVVLNTPHVVLLAPNAFLSTADNMAIVRQLHLAHREIAKVILVDFCDRELTVSSFRSGARGVFSISDANIRLLHKCIRRVAAGQVWANTEQLNWLLDLVSEAPSLRVVDFKGDQLLTHREEQVVALVAEGLANRDVARELNLSQHTIKKYLFRIFEKLGVSTRVELVLYAMNHGVRRGGAWPHGFPPAVEPE